MQGDQLMMNVKTVYYPLKIKHLFAGFFFLAALIFRLMTAHQLEITKPEAQILLQITQGNAGLNGQASILYQVLTIPLMRFFGNSNLVVRFWPLLAGSLLILLPLLFEDILGKRGAVILCFLIALDPFVNVNSIILSGNTITLCLLVLTADCLRKQRYLTGTISLIGLLLSGASLIYAGLLMIFLTIYGVLHTKRNPLKNTGAVLWDYLRQHLSLLGLIFVIIAVSTFLLQIPLSDFAGNFLYVLQRWGQPYNLGDTPPLYPIALLSYFPMGIILLIIQRSHNKNAPSTQLNLWILVSLIMIALNPGHQMIDLVWVSLPVCLLGALKLDEIITDQEAGSNRQGIYVTIFASLLVSLAITVVMVIYQFNWGLSVISGLLSTITLLIFITMAFIFLAYSESVSLAASTARLSALIVFLVIQVGFSWRALGLNGNPSAEILWGGYYQGADVVRQIIENADLDTVKTHLDHQVAFLAESNDAVKWGVSRTYPIKEQPLSLGEASHAVVITTTNDELTGRTFESYLGQQFIADSYPMWTWQPLKSLLDSDYWSWLIFRQARMCDGYQTIWVNQKVF
ncbi:MAG: hypothetical protein HPY72_02365 [Anaerolineae bacterium]|jgi:hypothetical protein|nr:hypothetical protein [Anaerolineae bacterium]